MKFKLLLLTSIVALTGCSNYRAGDCFQDVEDGMIWRITDVGLREFSAQIWADPQNSWYSGKTEFKRDLVDILLFRLTFFDNSEYHVPLPCPFSDLVISSEDDEDSVLNYTTEEELVAIAKTNTINRYGPDWYEKVMELKVRQFKDREGR